MNESANAFRNPYAYDGPTVAYPSVQKKRRRKSGRNIALMLLSVMLIAAVGAVVYSFMREHSVTVCLNSSFAVRNVRFGEIALPGATPNPDGNVIYSLDVPDGDYVFYAENDIGMSSGEQVLHVEEDATFTVIMPTQAPTPVPDFDVHPGQWMVQENGKYWIYDEKSGERTEPIGNPSKKIKIAEIKVNADLPAAILSALTK